MTHTTPREVVSMVSSRFSIELLQHCGFNKAIEAALDATGRWHQRACPLTAPLAMALVILLALERSLSISRVLDVLVRLMRFDGASLPLKVVSSEAVCHAKARLGVEPVRVLFEDSANRVRPEPSFRGLCVWVLDTMDLRVPDTPDNVAAFGLPGARAGRAGFPQVGVSVVLDVISRRVRAIALDRPTASERHIAIDLVKPLGSGDLLLQDRGLAAVWLFEYYRERGIDYLARIPVGWKPRILKRLGRGDYLVQLTGIRPVPFRNEDSPDSKPREITLVARMIEYRLGGHERVRLLTSLTDRSRYPARELACHYHARWDIEIAFDEIKTHFAAVPHGTMRTTLRSKTALGVEQEAYALFATYNLVRDLIRQAASTHHVPPTEISFIETLDVLRWAIGAFQAQPTLRRQLRAQLMRDIAACRIRRPRRPRICPRVVKTKTSRYNAKRPHHREEHNLARDGLRLVDWDAGVREAA